MLAFVCRRMLGKVGVADSVESFLKEKDLGLDAADISFEDFKKALSGRKAKIKSALMDQHKIAGIGNVYADEILFHAQIHPETPADDLSEEHIKKMYEKMMDIWKVAAKHNAQPKQMPEEFLLKSRRDGKPCPNGKGKIKKITVGGRSTYFCPDWQH